MKTIVFDIDGTITDEVGYLKKYAPAFFLKKYGILVSEQNPQGYKPEEIYDLSAAANGDRPVSGIGQAFWNHHFVRYCGQPLRPGAGELVRSLHRIGYRVGFVTMRGKRSHERESFCQRLIRCHIVPALTRAQLKRNGVRPDFLYFPETEEDKLFCIRMERPVYVYEDQPQLIRQISEDASCRVFCVDAPYNRDASVPGSRITCLLDSREEIPPVSSPEPGRKERHSFYHGLRILGSPIARLIYRPIVRGKMWVPKDTAVAFVGNHRTKSDPIVMTSLLPHMIHWAALLRMFTGGEDLFSNTGCHWRRNFSSWLMRKIEAVPIARETDADYQTINLKSIKFLLKQLQNRTASVGFFPEGTLNRKPDLQNILPLKSNQIFRMVRMTRCYLQPFSIVWIPKPLRSGLHSRVIVSFAIPINTEGRTAEELCLLWKQSVNEMIEDSNRLLSEAEQRTLKQNSRRPERS